MQDSTALGKVGTRRDARRYKEVYQLVLKVYQGSNQMLPSTLALPWGTYTFRHEFHTADLEPQCTTLKIHVTSTNTVFKGLYPTQCSHSPPSVNPDWLTAILFSQIPNLSLHAPLPLASTLPTPAVKRGKCFLCLHIKSPRRI